MEGPPEAILVPAGDWAGVLFEKQSPPRVKQGTYEAIVKRALGNRLTAKEIPSYEITLKEYGEKYFNQPVGEQGEML